ncbi:hypothetical protein OFB72_30035, partial [Escherichia coli]|nr:hypothetical protein [Escherichia coli]
EPVVDGSAADGLRSRLRAKSVSDSIGRVISTDNQYPNARVATAIPPTQTVTTKIGLTDRKK